VKTTKHIGNEGNKETMVREGSNFGDRFLPGNFVVLRWKRENESIGLKGGNRFGGMGRGWEGHHVTPRSLSVR